MLRKGGGKGNAALLGGGDHGQIVARNPPECLGQWFRGEKLRQPGLAGLLGGLDGCPPPTVQLVL